MDHQTLSELTALLKAKRDRLERELAQARSYPEFSSTQQGQVDEESESDEVEEHTNRLPVARMLQADFEAVNTALERIASGTYGRCTACGSEIPIERLRALPEAGTCGCK